MTFSVVARCPKSGQFGIAISSSSMAVAARCAFVRAGVGAVATQNITDPRLGPRGLDLMAAGRSAVDALAVLQAEHKQIDFRQLVLIDAKGIVARHSGKNTLGVHAVATGKGVAAAGNLLANTDVPAAMVAAFEAASAEDLGERLVRAMKAGLATGGEAGPVRSAGMVIAEKESWPIADLRVDWTEGDPIAALDALWQGWRGQMRDYVTRANDPSAAPGFGVPGDP